MSEPSPVKRAVWRKTWKAPDLGVVDEPMFISLIKYRPDDDRQPSDEPDHNLVSSHVVGTKLHAPIIDLDFPHEYVESTTPGHGHLYFNVPVRRWRMFALLIGLYLGGQIEMGNFWWSLRRGATYVRRRGVQKSTDAEKIHYTHGMFFKLREHRRGR